MRGITIPAALCVLVSLLAGAASASTLEEVRQRGRLLCGVDTGMTGFAVRTAAGDWEGFDVALCRAVAAAVFADPRAVEFVPDSSSRQLAALSEGRIDLVSRNTTWTFSRDTRLRLDFAGIYYFDRQGFILRKEMGVTSASELGGTRVCVVAGSTDALNLEDFFMTGGVEAELVEVADHDAAQEKYLAGECNVYSTDTSRLAATRATFSDPGAHMILSDFISKEPLGPVVRQTDPEWTDIVRWTLNTLIAAEELGVTSANVTEMSKGPTGNPEINRMLGTEGDFGAMLGLSPDWAVQVILAVGNYGEIFERNIGEKTPVGLARGLNALWTQGGLLYAPPFR
ncbi:MAG: amino acid ABC transporter substrate-binding protein [Alphaproteobacteria bacterium]|nr:MAG: amino acid ABC transporter substrate-binding protein [Alphaproteobacteria bacterium]